MMRRISRIVFLWGPVAAWCGLIFFLSHVPGLGTGWGVYDFVFRKIAHVAEYAVLAVLLWRALAGSGSFQPGTLFWAVLISSVFYAATDEFHQGFIPGRGPAVTDVLIDAVGATAACLWRRRPEKRRRRCPEESVL